MLDTILLDILQIYRDELKSRVENIKDDTIKVVEFYIEKKKFYVDMENNIYSRSNNNERLTGIKIGYLKDETLFLGGENTIKN